jgi:type I site-specific restriction endonuclease
MKISELVAKYIELRDKKAEYKNEYESKVAKLDEVLDKIESALLKTFETTGMDSVKTEHGTAYTTERSTASVADKDAFMAHIKAHEDWQLMEIRASKTAVQQYKDEHQDLPPGINWRSERVVNIRRS